MCLSEKWIGKEKRGRERLEFEENQVFFLFKENQFL